MTHVGIESIYDIYKNKNLQAKKRIDTESKKTVSIYCEKENKLL